MLIGFLVIGAALLVISGLVTLEVALLDARRAFVPKGDVQLAESSKSEHSGADECISVIDYVIAARLVTVSLAAIVGAVALLACMGGFGRSLPAAVGLTSETGVTGFAFYGGAAVCLLSLILVLGYVVPHFVGTRFRDSIIKGFSPLGRLVVRIAWPVITIAKLTKQLGVRKEGLKTIEEEGIEEDIRSLAEEGERAGVIEEEEREMISRVFRLGDKPIAALMTPRREVVFLTIGMSVGQAVSVVLDSRLSWFPVRQAEDDEVIGIVSVHDVFKLQAEYAPDVIAPLRDISVSAMDVPESLTALELLECFKGLGEHFAVVRDEYGGVAGIATVDDVLQVVVGDMDEGNGSDRSVTTRDDGSLLVDASLDVFNLFERIQLEPADNGDQGRFHSVGGFVMTSLGHIPKAGDSFMYDGYRFEVMDMDGKRIDKVLVTQVADRRVVGD